MTVRIIESGGGKITVRKNSGVDVGLRPRVNLIEGANITLTVTDDPTDNEIDVVIAATGDLGMSELSDDTTPQLGGDLELLEFLVLLDDALSADGKYSGIGENGTAGATLVFGDLCYFSALTVGGNSPTLRLRQPPRPSLESAYSRLLATDRPHGCFCGARYAQMPSSLP